MILQGSRHQKTIETQSYGEAARGQTTKFQNDTKMGPKGLPKWFQKWSQNGPKIDPKKPPKKIPKKVVLGSGSAAAEAAGGEGDINFVDGGGATKEPLLRPLLRLGLRSPTQHGPYRRPPGSVAGFRWASPNAADPRSGPRPCSQPRP